MIFYNLGHAQKKAFPEEIIPGRITIEDGIASEITTCFLHDSYGFIWIGTDKGLIRYDGYDFKTFTHNEYDSASISDDQIVCLCEDLRGNIWVGTFYGGLNKYDPDTETFTHYPKETDDPYNLSHSAIWAVCVIGNGEVWFSAIGDQFQSIYGVDPITGEIRYISSDPVDVTKPVDIHCHVIFEDSKGIIWAGSENCLLKYDTLKMEFIEVTESIPGLQKITSEVLSIAEDGNGDLWIGTWFEGIFKYSSHENRFTKYYRRTDQPILSERNSVYSLYSDSDNDLIFKNKNGIEFFDHEKEMFTSWDFNCRLSSYIRSLIPRSLYLDKNGLLWFGIPPGSDKPSGIYRIRLKKEGFTHFSGEMFLEKDLQGIWISSICEDNKGDLWLGGQNTGLIRIKKPHSDKKIQVYQATPDDSFSLTSNNISAIYEDSEGILWIGCWEEGILHRFEKSGVSERFIQYRPSDRFESGYIANPKDAFRYNDQSWDYTGAGCMRIYEDSQNRLWVGRGTGLELFDRERNKFYSYKFDLADTAPKKNPVITDIVEGRSGELWIASMFKGLLKLDPNFTFSTSDYQGGASSIYGNHLRISAGALKDAMITSLCVPSFNDEIVLWVGTWGKGLIGLLDSKKGSDDDARQIIHLTTGNGLPDNVILGIQEDDSGNLWVSTQSRLSKLDITGRFLNSYGQSDGVMIKSFHWFSNQKGKSGHMYFGGDEGLLAFHPEKIDEHPLVPPVVITDFRLFNQHVPVGEKSPLKRSITRTDRIELSYRENFLSFQFASLNYENTGKNRYRYMMEGIDRDWVDAGLIRSASYPNMRHGRYTFHVLGANNDGIWNDKGASVDIVIRPPPWLTWWAFLVYGLAIIGIILWYRSYLLSRAKLTAALEVERIEKKKLKELDHLKSRFFANISHEFRTPLTLLLGPIEDKLKSGKVLDPKEYRITEIMQRNAKRLHKLINQLLDVSKLESGKSRLQVIEGNISGFTKSIAQSFLSLAESRNINYRIKIPKCSISAYFAPDILEKILANLISNAFKFTPSKGSVTFTMYARQDELANSPLSVEFEIRDTGIGIPDDQIEKIFDRFYQVSSSDSREFEGTGIGLALCKELAELHHGNISVKSAPGKGSTFTVLLPCSRDQFSEYEIGSGKATIPNVDELSHEEESMEIIGTGGEKVGPLENDTPVLMIVEDNADLRHYMSQNLKDQYQIYEAVNGKEGLKKIIEIIPDLVITDLMMPEMDGTEMCKKMKSDERSSHIPLIMVTAKADRESRIEGLETGADDYLVKPFDADELKIRVSNMIEQQKRLREKIYKEFVFGENPPEVTGKEEQFLKKTVEHIRAHLSDPAFNVQDLCNELGISRVQLYRKLKGSLNMSPGELIRNTRLKSSFVLLKQGYDNISQIAYQVGFSDHSYFSKCFRELYGESPRKYTISHSGNHLE
jgi:signal transduction histidine kinase/DNA-binding response OmpR family regulator/ligand-binding sensor domain-containing protein